MKLQVLEKLLRQKTGNGKSYVVFAGLKELAMTFCFLAKRNGFALDGVVVINPTREPMEILPQDFSGVPIVDPNNLPFPAHLSFVVLAVPDPHFQPMRQSLTSMGFDAIQPLDNESAEEIFNTLQFENFTLETLRAELRSSSLDRIAIVDTGSKSRTLESILKFSGMPIEGVIAPSALKILNPPLC